MDALLLDLQKVCQQLLPIVGAIALVFLCILLKKAWKLIEQITHTIESLDPTLKKVDESMAKVQAPLDTVVRLSHTVDSVQDKTAEAFGKMGDTLNEGMKNLKEFTDSKKAAKTVEETEVQAPAANVKEEN